MRRIVVLSAAVACLAAPAHGAPPVQIDGAMTGAQKGKVKAALQAVEKSCPMLGHYWSVVRTVSVRYLTADLLAYRREYFGWKQAFHFRVQFQKSITNPANGMVCHFYVGGPNAPGVVTSKASCIQLCLGNGADAFFPSTGAEKVFPRKKAAPSAKPKSETKKDEKW